MYCNDCGEGFEPRSAAQRRCAQCVGKPCKNCDQKFLAHDMKHQIFCSLHCRDRYNHLNRLRVFCKKCDTEIEGAARNKRKFCSMECRDDFRSAEHAANVLENYRVEGDCFLYNGSLRGGRYGYTTIYGNEIAVHRHALEVELGRKLEQGEFALHTCDNPPCINPEHLYPGTAAQNTRDMMDRGRQVLTIGQDRAQAKLTDDGVRLARRMLKAGERQQDIAEALGISRTAVSAISTGRTWSHVH